MDKVKEIFNTPDHVKEYDKKTKKSNWLGPEMLLGLSFRHISPGEKILDIGIGTGLTSVLYKKAGLRVYGMDFSSEMLKACKEKKIADELKEHDLRQIPYPYETNSMDHAICGGVLHMFENIRPIFEEISRIIRLNGVFVFCCIDNNANGIDKISVKSERSKTTAYSHSQASIETLLKECGFALLNVMEFFILMQGDKAQKRCFKAYAAQNYNKSR